MLIFSLCNLKLRMYSELIIRESQKSGVMKMLDLLVIVNSFYKGIWWYNSIAASNVAIPLLNLQGKLLPQRRGYMAPQYMYKLRHK